MFQDLKDYSDPDSKSEKLDIVGYAQMTILMIVPENDGVCTPEQAQRIFFDLKSPNKFLRYVRDNGGLEVDHSFFLKSSGDLFVKTLIESIENNEVSDIKAMDPLEVAKVYLSNRFILHPITSFLIAAVLVLVVFICLGNLLVICLILGAVKDATEHEKIEVHEII